MEQSQLIKSELAALGNPTKAKGALRFFKTGKGEYGEGDIFIGVTVPETRSIAKKYSYTATITDVTQLLHSKIHEERACALMILVLRFKNKKTTEQEQKEIVDLYLANTKYINNWDLVDISSHEIVGAYVYKHPQEKKILIALAKSLVLWERRIAMVSCYHFIKNKEFDSALLIAQMLLTDTHDLMHKAVGWMLREIGKRDAAVLRKFLDENVKKMPRTALRYSIERFSEKERKEWLAK